MHRRPEGGGQPGAVAPLLEFENDDVICCSHGKYPKIFARAFGARIKYPYIESKTPKKSRKFSFAPSARQKVGHFCQSMRFCPPSEKFLRAPMHVCLTIWLFYSNEIVQRTVMNHVLWLEKKRLQFFPGNKKIPRNKKLVKYIMQRLPRQLDLCWRLLA